MTVLSKLILLPLTFSLLFQTSDRVRTDGVIQTDEWKGAKEYDLGNGNKLLMLQEKDLLYVALSSKEKFWTHVYLSNGKEVKVMHASAALDAIHYKNDGYRWLTSEAFKYEMRGNLYDDELEKKMEEYFKTNGWVSNNSNTGDGKTMEFKLSTQTSLYFACVMSSYDMKFTTFPTGLSDNAILPRLVQGYAVDSLNFKPETWVKIK